MHFPQELSRIEYQEDLPRRVLCLRVALLHAQVTSHRHTLPLVLRTAPR